MIELALSEYCEMLSDVVSEACLSVEPECRIRLSVIRSKSGVFQSSKEYPWSNSDVRLKPCFVVTKRHVQWCEREYSKVRTCDVCRANACP